MLDPETLISRYFHDHPSMTQGDLDELSEWIRQDPSHAKRFACAAFVHRALYDCLTGEEIQGAVSTRGGQAAPDDSGVLWDDRFWHRIAEYEKKAPALSVQRPPAQERRLQREGEPRKLAQKPSRALLSMGVLCLIVLLLLLVAGRIDRDGSGQDVATLRNSMHAVFADGESLAPGTRLNNRKAPLRLEQGMVGVTFDNGAEVLIEGPGVFRLTSAGRMELYSGRLFAGVSQRAKGFCVDMPSSSIVDLGTEFGVRVDLDRTSEVHLFKGKASLIPGPEGRGGRGQFLTEGQARSVGTEGTVRDIHVDTNAFVRRFFPKSGLAWRGQPLDLADVVGGGNGFGTGRLGRWIDIATGNDGTPFEVNGVLSVPCRVTDHHYHRVSHLPYVDGVFSPDGGAGKVQVSSRGHVWQGCPKTGGRFFEDIFNGDYIPVQGHSHGLVLAGQFYGTREHPAIALHSNAGITFDLEALRAALPGLGIDRFRATCGISEEAKAYAAEVPEMKADFWVLVDGEKRFEATGVRADSGPREVSVSLSEKDRFVTLATTDADGVCNYDWCFFAEPRLDLSAAEPR